MYYYGQFEHGFVIKHRERHAEPSVVLLVTVFSCAPAAAQPLDILDFLKTQIQKEVDRQQKRERRRQRKEHSRDQTYCSEGDLQKCRSRQTTF